jgi:hypothetical protein
MKRFDSRPADSSITAKRPRCVNEQYIRCLCKISSGSFCDQLKIDREKAVAYIEKLKIDGGSQLKISELERMILRIDSLILDINNVMKKK